MFRTAVVEYQDAVRSKHVAEARAKVRLLETRYLGETSAFEINRQASTRALSELPDEELKVDLFDSVLEQIDRDLGRALQTLWASAVFKVPPRAPESALLALPLMPFSAGLCEAPSSGERRQCAGAACESGAAEQRARSRGQWSQHRGAGARAGGLWKPKAAADEAAL